VNGFWLTDCLAVVEEICDRRELASAPVGDRG
jgi:hypothetical protein